MDFGKARQFGKFLQVGVAVGTLAMGTSVLGQTVYVIEAGGGASIDAYGGDTLELEVWVSDFASGPALREFQATLPCGASGGDAGTVGYAGGSPTVDDQRADYVFNGLTETVSGSSSGNCRSVTPSEFPSAKRGVSLGNGVNASAKYLATFYYDVSTDAEGTFTIDPYEGSCLGTGTYLREDTKGSVCFDEVDFEGVTINVPIGRCCIDEGCSLDCEEDVTEYACDQLGGVFAEGEDCTGGCPCQTGSHCDDGDSCTRDVCTAGTCSNPTNVAFGDIVPCGGDGFANLFDAQAVILAFQGTDLCPVCDGSGGECGSPAPAPPGGIANAVNRADYSFVVVDDAQLPGGAYRLDVFASDVEDLGAYQLVAQVSGGDAGSLALASVAVEQRRDDFIFADAPSHFLIVNQEQGRIDAGVLGETVDLSGPVYIGTFVWQSSPEARGAFLVTLTADGGQSGMTSAQLESGRRVAEVVLDVP